MPSYLSKKIIGLSFFALCCSACHQEFTKNEKLTNDKPIVLPVERSKQALTLTSNKYGIGITKIDSSQLVAEISKLLIVNNQLFILDVKSKSFFCFNKDGVIRWNYSKLGKGPQEHDNLIDFSIRDKFIYLLDKYNKVLKLDFNGKFISSQRVNVRKPDLLANLIYVNDDKRIVAYNNDLGDKRDVPYSLVTLDTPLAKIESVYLRKRHAPGDMAWLSSAFPMQVFTDDKGFFYTEALNDTIYTYKSKTFKRSYVVDFGKNKMPESYLKLKQHAITDFWKTSYGGNICNVFQTDSLISFKTTIAGQNYFHFLDKTSNHVKNYQIVVFKTKFFYSIAQFIGATKDRYYFTVEPDELLRSYRYIKDHLYKNVPIKTFDQILSSKDPVYASLLKDINIYSNQIIVSVRISPNSVFNNE